VQRYRYRTPVLTGPWRESPEDAVQDAVRSKQAQLDNRQPSGVKWTVPGQIEERNNEGAQSSAKG
jgi:hypothetical protein